MTGGTLDTRDKYQRPLLDHEAVVWKAQRWVPLFDDGTRTESETSQEKQEDEGKGFPLTQGAMAAFGWHAGVANKACATFWMECLNNSSSTG